MIIGLRTKPNNLESRKSTQSNVNSTILIIANNQSTLSLMSLPMSISMIQAIVKSILLHVRAQFLLETVKILPLSQQQNNSELMNVITVLFH